MIGIRREKFGRHDIETIADNDGIMWLNEKKIEECLDHQNLREFTLKHLSNHRNYRHKLDNKSRKQCNWLLTDEKLAIKVIMIGEQYQLIKWEQDYDLNNMMSFKQKNNQC